MRGILLSIMVLMMTAMVFDAQTVTAEMSEKEYHSKMWELMKYQSDDEAKQTIQEGIEAYPDSSQLMTDLGLLYINMARFTDAIEVLEKVVEEENDLFALHYLVYALLWEGRAEEAVGRAKTIADMDDGYESYTQVLEMLLPFAPFIRGMKTSGPQWESTLETDEPYIFYGSYEFVTSFHTGGKGTNVTGDTSARFFLTPLGTYFVSVGSKLDIQQEFASNHMDLLGNVKGEWKQKVDIDNSSTMMNFPPVFYPLTNFLGNHWENRTLVETSSNVSRGEIIGNCYVPMRMRPDGAGGTKVYMSNYPVCMGKPAAQIKDSHKGLQQTNSVVLSVNESRSTHKAGVLKIRTTTGMDEGSGNSETTEIDSGKKETNSYQQPGSSSCIINYSHPDGTAEAEYCDGKPIMQVPSFKTEYPKDCADAYEKRIAIARKIESITGESVNLRIPGACQRDDKQDRQTIESQNRDTGEKKKAASGGEEVSFKQAVSLAGKYFDEGNYEEAKKYYTIAIDYKPDDPDFHYNIGLCCDELGESKEAARHFRKYLELSPDAEDADEVRGWIEELERK